MGSQKGVDGRWEGGGKEKEEGVEKDGSGVKKESERREGSEVLEGGAGVYVLSTESLKKIIDALK